jgi:hypothetical protein
LNIEEVKRKDKDIADCQDQSAIGNQESAMNLLTRCLNVHIDLLRSSASKQTASENEEQDQNNDYEDSYNRNHTRTSPATTIIFSHDAALLLDSELLLGGNGAGDDRLFHRDHRSSITLSLTKQKRQQLDAVSFEPLVLKHCYARGRRVAGGVGRTSPG